MDGRVAGSNRLGKARWAINALFICNGAGFGLWAGHLAVFARQFQLDSLQMSLLLGAMVGGAMIAMSICGKLLVQGNSDRLAPLFGCSYAVALILLGASPNRDALLAAALLFGFCKGGLDVVQNSQSAVIETAFARPIMSSIQACWSIGGLLGAGLSSLTIARGFPVRSTLASFAILMMIAVLFCRGFLLPDRHSAKSAAAGANWRNPDVLRLGLLAFLCLFCEGAVADWSGVFLVESLRITASAAAFGYGAYSVAMAVGRLVGDRVVRLRGPSRTLRTSGVLVALGMLLVLLHRSYPLSLAGLIAMGLGLANAVPVIFSAAARIPGIGGSGVAQVSTVGYLGFLAGPPVIGTIAHGTGLTLALGLLNLAGVAVAICAPLAGPVVPLPEAAGEGVQD
jgi:predicted MFS family arabinose efflux permease